MKTITKNMTNAEIYNIALALNKNELQEDIYFPAAVSFSIQKNKAHILEKANGIEDNRVNIIKHYGSVKEDGSFTIPEENIEKANQELSDLLSITQEVKIFTFSIDSLDDVKLTSSQMQSLIFMIDDEEN